MRKALVLAAAVIILVSNLWALILSRQNRAEPRAGTLELTERELALPALAGDSTAIVLGLQLGPPAGSNENGWSPGWLNLAKLAELGFDCQVPIDSPKAAEHYSSLSSIMVYAVLEYQGDNRDPSHPTSGMKSRLVAVDAGKDPRKLRENHPNFSRCIITRCLVRPFWEVRQMRDQTPLPQPQVRARLELVPNQVFVPAPYIKLLQPLRRHGAGAQEKTFQAPRFAATVSWGTRCEPWLQSVRLLPAANLEPTY